MCLISKYFRPLKKKQTVYLNKAMYFEIFRFKKENYAKELLEKIQKSEKFVIMEKEAVASVLEVIYLRIFLHITRFLENSLKEMKRMISIEAQ